MFLAGFLAITGSPPFAPFVSEFQILQATVAAGQLGAAAIFVACLLVVFLGFGATTLRISFGRPSEADTPAGFHDHAGTGLSILALMGLTLLLGVYQPPLLERLLAEAAAFLAGPTGS
jgi:hydrogenase-4 component F